MHCRTRVAHRTCRDHNACSNASNLCYSTPNITCHNTGWCRGLGGCDTLRHCARNCTWLPRRLQGRTVQGPTDAVTKFMPAIQTVVTKRNVWECHSKCQLRNCMQLWRVSMRLMDAVLDRCAPRGRRFASSRASERHSSCTAAPT